MLEFARVTESSEHDRRFEGIARLYGRSGAARLREARVCVVGIGGVGSWAVEALARCGIGQLVLVDLDEVCASNINRQLPALTSTIGRSKVEVMRSRVLEINPGCSVDAREEFFTTQTADGLLAGRFDACLDAIDSVSNKALLIARCRDAGIPIVTAGAAGGRRNPAAVRTADLTEASHDRLLQQVRKILRTEHGFPRNGKRFGVDAVFSPEPAVHPEGESCEPSHLNCNTGYGSATFVTGAFGFAAASLVVRRLTEERPK